MRKYTPRRAGKRWLEGAPAYVLDCFDNRGRTYDRYSVIFGHPYIWTDPGRGETASAANTYLYILDMSPDPFHPQGIGVSGQYPAYLIAHYRYREKYHRVRWCVLPELVRKCVVQWAMEMQNG